MDQIKIDNFVRGNSGKTFPNFVTLDSNSCSKMRTELSNRLGLNSSKVDGFELVTEVTRRSEFYMSFNPDGEIEIEKIMSFLKVKPQEYIYINWYRYDLIDRMILSELVEYFDDIWYPAVDDIDVFDESLSRVLSITHFGQVKTLRL